MSRADAPSATAPHHEPVMVAEVIEGLDVRPGGTYIDATVGLGGHAEAILEAARPHGRLLGIDLDPQALDLARVRLAPFGNEVVLRHGHFQDIASHARAADLDEVDGVLFDLGVSSYQLDSSGRGFSFRGDEPLDMRMDPTRGQTAAEVVNETSEEELATIIYRFGEERRSRAIARAIVSARPVHTTAELLGAVEQAVGKGRERRIHPATLTFQALRIAVNQELDSLVEALSAACGLLAGPVGDRHGARLVVIAFHSLEDRIVKDYLRRESTECICPPRMLVCTCGHSATLRLISRRVRKPSADEIATNPRARSARLRVAEAIVAPRAA